MQALTQDEIEVVSGGLTFIWTSTGGYLIGGGGLVMEPMPPRSATPDN